MSEGGKQMKLVKYNPYVIFKEGPKSLKEVEVEAIRSKALITIGE